MLNNNSPADLQLSADFPSNVYKDFQAALLALQQQGFLLALATKNDEAAVHEVLDSHPDLLLRRRHFASICAGWQPKSVGFR